MLAQNGTSGVLVLGVDPDGPAARAGLIPARISGDGLIVAGDRIVGLGATKVDEAVDLIAALEAHRPGDQVELHIRRGDQRKSLKITLGEPR